jgi:hypothetical protein
MAKKETEETTETTEPKVGHVPLWQTTVKLGAIDEAKYAQPGDVVVAVNTASGELTLQRACKDAPYGRSTGGL